MTNWRSVSSPSFVPSSVDTLIGGVGRLVSAGTTVLNASTVALQAAEALATSANENPLEAALGQLIDGLTKVLDGLASQTTAHTIFIPFQKQIYGLGNSRPTDDVNEQLSGNLAEDLEDSPSYLQQFIIGSQASTGGTQGFFRTLAQSINDEGDISRPDFPDNFAVGGSVIIFGAATLTDLTSTLNVLQTWFGSSGSRAEFIQSGLPTIEGFEVTMVPRTEGSANVMSAQLTWDAVPRVQLPTSYSNDVIRTEELIVVRSTDPTFREALEWSDVFPKDLGENEMPSVGETQVVSRINNDGFIRQTFDVSNLEFGVTYYYAILPRYTINNVQQPMGRFSAVRKLIFDRPVITKNSIAPDWAATPSIIEVFPPIQELVAETTIALNQLRSRTLSDSGNLASIQALIAQAQRQVESLESTANEITEILDVLRGLSDTTVQLYTSTISVRDGGIRNWISEVGDCLSNPEDPTRPVFEDTDLVAGIVVVGGAPSFGQLSEFLTALNLFFGNLGNPSPIVEVANFFSQNASEPAAATVQETDTPAFNAAMEVVNSDEAEC